MVHSGLEMIPLVGRGIPTNALAASFYVELHGIAEIVGDRFLVLVVVWLGQFQWRMGTHGHGLCAEKSDQDCAHF